MVLKFHMQPDQTAGLENDKIQHRCKSVKLAKPIKSTFSSEPLGIFG